MEMLRLLVVTVVVDQVGPEMEVLIQPWTVSHGVRYSEKQEVESMVPAWSPWRRERGGETSIAQWCSGDFLRVVLGCYGSIKVAMNQGLHMVQTPASFLFSCSCLSAVP